VTQAISFTISHSSVLTWKISQLRGRFEAFPRLWDHVNEYGGEEDAGAHAEDHGQDSVHDAGAEAKRAGHDEHGQEASA
jgi:hypothetical protein